MSTPAPPASGSPFFSAGASTNPALAATLRTLETLRLQLIASAERWMVLRPGVKTYGQSSDLCTHSVLQPLNLSGSRKAAIYAEALAALGPGADAAAGALVGACVGDGVGAPLEFLPVTSQPYPKTLQEAEKVYEQQGRPFLAGCLFKGELLYCDEENRFGLKRGQWTDDASMALCMCDSLLLHDAYCGGDIRIRFYNWWTHGYNNSFRFDLHRLSTWGGTSVGLGGNISKSIDDLLRFMQAPPTDVPPRFESTGEDAGNGSIMRLAPVPIRYWRHPGEGMHFAAESSGTTHPGPDAAACCRFMAFLIGECVRRAHAQGALLCTTMTMAEFLEQGVTDYLALRASMAPAASAASSSSSLSSGSSSPSLAPADAAAPSSATDTGEQKLQRLLQSTPPSPKETCWNWKAGPALSVEETILQRGRLYNGYPVTAGYFGSYCMDGLAMALHGLRNASSFSGSVLNIVNLLGDCDTTGSIGAQIAGAFYGVSGIESDAMGQKMMANFCKWDAEADIRLKAVMLFYAGLERRPADGTAAAATPSSRLSSPNAKPSDVEC